jgi:hypothetical protein
MRVPVGEFEVFYPGGEVGPGLDPRGVLGAGVPGGEPLYQVAVL